MMASADVDMEPAPSNGVIARAEDVGMRRLLDEKTKGLQRVRAQRNELNQKVRKLKEELEEILDQGCYVGEVLKMMDREKVLVKVSSALSLQTFLACT